MPGILQFRAFAPTGGQPDSRWERRPISKSNPTSTKRKKRASNLVLAFMDCEFGGLDPELHDITEIAVVVTDYRLAELARGEWKVFARADRISEEGAAIGGYDEEAWKGTPPLRQVLQELSDLMPANALVVPAGQNVRMDVIFLERGYRNCEIPFPFDYHVIDLATLFYTWSLISGEQVSALSLRQAALTAGLIENAIPHRAMADATLTLETFRHFIGRLALRDPADWLPEAKD
jgi:oligoribonuclease (3'-5' exoribonuclease)